MKIVFNHPEEPNLFKFLENDYDAEKLCQIVKSKIDQLFNFLNMEYTLSEDVDRTKDIKFSDIYKVLTISSQYKNKPVKISIKIPNIHNSYCIVSGVKRYVQKQIIDTAFINMNSETSERLVCEYDTTFTVSKRKNDIYFNIKGMSPLKAIPLYLYMTAQTEEPSKLDELASEDDFINNLLQQYSSISKDKLFSEINNSLSSLQKKKTITLLNTYYEMSDILQSYCETPADIIYQLIKRIEEKDNTIGLDLRTRRLRTTSEIIISHIVGTLIEFLVNLHYSNKQSKQHVLKIEPYQNLYDFILAETMFNAPLASVSNRCRCTITGPNGFSRDGIPIKVKDLHPSQYGNLDPAVTPDRENAGVVLYLASICEIDKLGRFKINEDFMEYCKPLLEARHESFNK